MDILFLLVPLSVLIVFALMALFAWSLHAGQLDDLEREGERILEDDAPGLDADQALRRGRLRHSSHRVEEES